MRVRWFGEPWPDAELRAPVCEDDAYRIDPPTHACCLRCELPISDTDQGIVMACRPSFDEDITFTLDEHTVCAEHLYCFLLSVLGHQIAAQCDP